MPPWLTEWIDAFVSRVTEGWPLLLSWWPVLLPSLLALLFLGLWLRARARAPEPALEEELRQTKNELKRLKGDAIQIRRQHAAEIEKLTGELNRLRAGDGPRR